MDLQRTQENRQLGTEEDPSALAVKESIIFLGQEYSAEEYQVACKNLSDFFSILARWAEKAKKDEKKTDQ